MTPLQSSLILYFNYLANKYLVMVVNTEYHIIYCHSGMEYSAATNAVLFLQCAFSTGLPSLKMLLSLQSKWKTDVIFKTEERILIHIIKLCKVTYIKQLKIFLSYKMVSVFNHVSIGTV